jgi:hypothetical protein
LYDQLENATGTATITVTQDTTLAESIISISKASSITLRGNAARRTVSGPSEGCYIVVERGVTLTLENLTLRGISISVEDGGALMMNDSAALTVDKRNQVGVLVERGTFTMNGGRISGASHYGVALSEGGSFFMKGGRIENNEENGVAVSQGTFTMSGGTIAGNNNTGVTVVQGAFTMSGGTIANNGTLEEVVGGVLVATDGAFRKTGGTIYGSNGGSNANKGKGGGNAVGVLRFDGNHVFINYTVGPNERLNF